MRDKARKSFRSQVKYYYNPVNEVKSQCVYSDKTIKEEWDKGQDCVKHPNTMPSSSQRVVSEAGKGATLLWRNLWRLRQATIHVTWLEQVHGIIVIPSSAIHSCSATNQSKVNLLHCIPASHHKFQSTKAMAKHGPRYVRTQDYDCPLLNLSCKPTQKIANNKCPH